MKLDLDDNELVNALSRTGRQCLLGNPRSILIGKDLRERFSLFSD